MSEDDHKTFWDHLDELARRLRRIFLSIAITTIIVSLLPADIEDLNKFNLSNYRSLVSFLIEIIQKKLLPEEASLVAFTWLDALYIYIFVAVSLGIILSLPIIAYEMYQFLMPALYPQEKNYIYIYIFFFNTFFSQVLSMPISSYYPITFKILMRFIYQIRIMPLLSIRDFFNVVILGLLGSGLFYTSPLLILILIKLELIDIETLKENRKKIFIGLLILTAILTPDPTPLSMLLLSIPFYLLYELTIHLAGRVMRSARKE